MMCAQIRTNISCKNYIMYKKIRQSFALSVHDQMMLTGERRDKSGMQKSICGCVSGYFEGW